jgi:trimeric autotransporter adhesin
MQSIRFAALGALLCASVAISGLVHAIAPHADQVHRDAILPELRVSADGLEVTASLLAHAQQDVRVAARAASFLQQHGSEWEIRWDARGDRPALIQGSGVPLLPGRGNTLPPHSVALSGDMQHDLPVVALRARAFIDSQADLLDSKQLELVLDPERSTAFGPGNERWFLEFQQHHRGIPVDGAFVHVRIVHGNIVQFGAERIGDVALAIRKGTLRDRDAVFQGAWAQLGFPADTRVQEWLEQGALRIFPSLPAGQMLATEHGGLRGMGYSHVLAWRFVFRVDEHATWQILVDADNGSIIDLRDLTVHADAVVGGGVYPSTNTDPVVAVEFPFTTVSNNGTKITDIDGVYDYSGGTATSALGGRYFRMQDNCGAISLSSTTDGNLDFGTSGGTDCTTPGFGGAGNTHASRTGFYHLTLINAKARELLPSNNWLQGTVTANMNINNQCNATWNGTAVNFYRSGGGCSNTGEIAAVFLHEWGHGIDTNTGGAASENASGEAVGDTFAFLETRDSCIGPNFRPGIPCHNCTSCTGVRDMADFALGGARTLATPANVTNAAGLNCGRFSCPYSTPQGFPYRGPMGYQGHCESHIASTANWDLKNALVEEFGESGWQRMDRIWYGSLVPSKSAYQVASGGQCNVGATVNGCGATNWYTVFLAADDDDGNLANGTPNACRIWDALDAHGIACGTRPACTEFAVPDFALAVAEPSQGVCAGDDAQFVIDVESRFGFTGPVSLGVAGQPAAAGSSFSVNPVVPGNASVLSIVDTGLVPAGIYAMVLSGAAAGSEGHAFDLSLRVDTDAPSHPALSLPTHDATEVDTSPLLSWQAVPDAITYRVQVALDPAFEQIVADQAGLTSTSWQAPLLAAATRHYWRVLAQNGCGESTASAAFAFTTVARYCSAPNVAIPDNNPSGVTDTIVIDSEAELASMRLTIRANHTYVGDLAFRLSRGTDTALVIDRPGVPGSTYGCSGDNIDVRLDDDAAQPVETQCAASVPTISGTFRPNALMGPVFAGTPLDGSWALTATDAVATDTGVLLEWCLEPVTAAPQTYAVGGVVAGYQNGGLSLSLNDGPALAIAGDGAFAFADALPDGTGYSVAVVDQPVSPRQICAISNGEGVVAGADVTDIDVQCISVYTVGGTVTNLLGSGLRLSLNDGPALDVDGPTFSFAGVLVDGAVYSIAVVTQPADPLQTCSVRNGQGVVDAADVVNIEVECVDRHRIGGRVLGLVGSGLGLRLDDGPLLLVDAAEFTFPEDLLDGSSYSVTVAAQPVNPEQTCAVVDGSGVVAAADVQVVVVCEETVFRDGFE